MGDESMKANGEQTGGGGGGGGMMEQYQVLGGGVPVQVSGAPQLPALAPAPVSQHGLHMAGGGAAVPGSQGGAVASQPGMNMQPAMGQPQFQVIQPTFPSGGQYATIPQFATYNSQGQLVLQPAHFMQPGQPGQAGQLILSGVPQPQQGKPGLMGSQPSTPSKPGMQYTMTSTGQLQMQPGSQPTFIMAPQPMASPMPGQQVVPTSLAQMKAGEGKGMMTAPQQPVPPQQHSQQQFLLPNGQMAYMQPGPAPPQQILQNGQIIFRSPGPEGQQLMFSPSGPPSGPPQVPQSVPAASAPLQMQSPMPMPQMTRPSSVPTAPPGKTAISRAIAPLPSSVTQSGPRMGFNQGGNQPNQSSPKSKQKMSPRGNVGPGRPPGPKAVSTPKMIAKVPGPVESLAGKTEGGSSGPPTLLPQMLPAQPVSLSTATPAPPQSMLVSMPPMAVKPLYQMSTSIPTSTVTPIISQPLPGGEKQGPPTLTKEINPPMPNLGPPNISGSAGQPGLGRPVLMGQPTTQPLAAGEPALLSTPKAVVKPQVLTHVIDGHIIKESSTPFPVSPSKKGVTLPSTNTNSKAINELEKMLDTNKDTTAPLRRKSEKDENKTVPSTNAVPVKRGPGRPPGSNNKNSENKVKSLDLQQPPEKKLKSDGGKETVAPLVNVNTPTTTPPSAPTILPASPKNNPLKWNVQQVCDFIKKLPGCSDYVEDFMLQEIDGQALMLLQADHLMTAMSIKLGPALKICEQVKQLKDDLAKN